MLPNPQETVYLVTFTEEILNGNLHFLCSVYTKKMEKLSLITYTAPKHTIFNVGINNQIGLLENGINWS